MVVRLFVKKKDIDWIKISVCNNEKSGHVKYSNKENDIFDRRSEPFKRHFLTRFHIDSLLSQLKTQGAFQVRKAEAETQVVQLLGQYPPAFQ
jgi:hypothetical protein